MNSAKTFEEFKAILKSEEKKTFFKYNVYKNHVGFLDKKCEISANMRLHWKDGVPYFHLGKRIYTCHQGKDKNISKKRKYVEEKQEKARKNIFQKTYNLTNPTKKLDCPATIAVIRVYALPQLKLENPTYSRKQTVSLKIKNKLRNNEDVEGEEAFWFTLPSADAHKNHMPIESSEIKKRKKRVHSKIKDIVHEGEKNVFSMDNVQDEVVELVSEEDQEESRGEILLAIEHILDSHDDAISKENQEESQGSTLCGELEQRKNKRRKLDVLQLAIEHIQESHDDAISKENEQESQGSTLCGELEQRENKRRKLIDECNSHLQNLSSVLWVLPESSLSELEKSLKKLALKMQKRVNLDDATGLPSEVNKHRTNCNGVPTDKVERAKSKANKGATAVSILNQRAKRGLAGKVGIQANAVKQTCKPVVIIVQSK